MSQNPTPFKNHTSTLSQSRVIFKKASERASEQNEFALMQLFLVGPDEILIHQVELTGRVQTEQGNHDGAITNLDFRMAQFE